MISEIFYKDLKRSSRWLLVFPFLLIEWLVVYYAFADRLNLEVDRETFIVGCLTVAFVMNTIIAMVVGIGVKSDEETSGTDQFLRRLPISKTQVLQEKILSSLSFLLFIYVATIAFYFAFLPEGVELFVNDRRPEIGSYVSNLLVAILSAFVFAVVSSFYFKQQIIIFFATLIAVILLWLLALLSVTRTDIQTSGAMLTIVYLLLFFGLPGLLARKQWRFALNPTIWGTPQSRTLFKGLVWKNIAQEGSLYLVGVGLLVSAIVYGVLSVDIESLTSRQLFDLQTSIPYMVIASLAIFLPIAVGAGAYSSTEGRGLECVFYSHPVSRSQLFFSKLIAATPILVVSYLGLLLTISDRWPWFSLLVWTIFTYSIALHISLWISSVVLIIFAAMSWGIFLGSMILIWMEPTPELLFFGDFVPVNDYRIVATIPLSLLTIGSLITSWRMATNRRFLAGSATLKAKFNLLESGAVYVFTIVGVGIIQQYVVL